MPCNYLIYWRLPLTSRWGVKVIAQPMYRLDRSYSWNYSHSPILPRVRRVPPGPGGKLLDHVLNSPVGIAAGPLLNSKWVEAYSRVGFDVLTYRTVRSMAMPAHPLPNIRPVENREHAAIATKRTSIDSQPTLAVSLGIPSAEPEVWRKDVRRAKDRIGDGQVLIVSVVGTWAPGMDAEQLIQDYARCAAWAAEAGADAVEVHLAVTDPFAEQPQLIYENIPLAAQILYRVRTTVPKPVLAKLGVFRTPRLLHETATKLASWANGFVMTHGVRRRVLEEDGNVAFEGPGRDRATIVGADTWPLASRQIEEMLSWRKAGAWDRAILGVGGVTTVERADHLLREGADVALIATTALFDPLFGIRFRQLRATAVA
jgi:dihydroorotate dehydrogenase (NAD+) catalytic subunit